MRAPCLAVSAHRLFSECIFWDCGGDALLLYIKTCCRYRCSFLRYSSLWTRDHSCFHQETSVVLRRQAFDEPGLHFGLNVFKMGEVQIHCC